MESVAIEYATEFLESWLGFRAQQVDVPGFSVAVRSGDAEIFSGAYGMADIAMQIPMTTNHLFAIGSQSKMFTATAVLQLVAAGSVRLDEHVVHYLPWLARHQDPDFQTLTVRHLLSHSAGLIRDGERSDYWLGKRVFPSSNELRKIVHAESLSLEPNAQMKYSNLGFALLGQVVEAASGQTYTSYIAKQILSPLGLRMTHPDWRSALRTRMAMGYTMPFERKRMAAEHASPMRTLAPAAGCLATPTDMCRFAAAHFLGDNTLLGDELKKEAQHSQWTITKGYDRGYEYGLGFEIIEVAGRRLFGHGGSMLGYRTATFFDPRAKLAVAVAVNCKDAPALAMTRGIFGALFHFIDTAVQPTPPRLAKFNAQLRSPLANVRILATKNAIVAIDPNVWEPFAWNEQLECEDNNTLRIATPNSVHSHGEKVAYAFKGKEVVRVNYSGLPMEPASTLKSPNEPHTLLRVDAEALFLERLKLARQSVFMLEVLPEYEIDMRYEGSGDSLKAWLQGKTNKSIALLAKFATTDAERPPWLRISSELKLTGPAVRIRVVGDEVTSHMRWERESFSRINVPLGGEKIYYMPRKYLKHLVLPTGDTMIFDDNQVTVNSYNGAVCTHRTFYNTSHQETTRFLDLKQQILREVARHHLSAVV